MVLMTPLFVLNVEEILELVEDLHLDLSLLMHYRHNALSPQTWEENRAVNLF